ncbi:MAG TPA: tRNA (guanine(10)-N(2))-dimethyltransferase, partial [Candidatus Thermoplasmatota archaeon]|nr:tRNA (guanine(10)-N(2))-dimethyltransferase [Candidatus Thermoplasmatota archaeon]
MESLVERMEGKARLLLPEAERSERGPESKETAAVFYNPAMALNRDLSSLLVQALAQPGWHALDGLAASGVRGIRYALESDGAVQPEWNDWNPVAAKLIGENARLNGLEPRVTSRNLAGLLHERVWHVVDVDPFGSPAPFLDAATRAVRDGGLLGITATDATALAGVFPKPCLRRYGAAPLHGELGHEVALRILAGAAARAAARHDLALRPVLAHATDHYYRVALRCARGASRADDALAEVGRLWLCPACGARGFGEARACAECGAPPRLAGPLWTGALCDAAALGAMLERAPRAWLARPQEAWDLLQLLADEARVPHL